MELLTVDSRLKPYPLRRPDALEVAAWRPPPTVRFDGRAANDVDILAAAPPPEPAMAFQPAIPVAEPVPVREPVVIPDWLISDWAIAVGGGGVAALLGLLLGAVFAI